ncbi:ZIP family zinc transporter/zinc and cadmium transporter [Halospina denitrificans]|uniref:ZIP family zinc transporter/zinc and cadmium transporter n=1 Tax=Halospina denitrificans TaxID=332522 RepID=A0A4R7JUD3_9GAMM|nr:ZIP family metal transporter [Halospina denitrificans]TDT41446.1 ZIP family zinc transporter/zinc and cadmium transporter [Halospina denitrificans]
MENSFWTAFGASLLAALVTGIGIYTIRHFEAWGRKYSIYFVCFAAGVLISVSFLHIIPKSFELSPYAPGYLLGGFVLMHMFNRFITAFVCERGANPAYGIGLVPMVGIGFHSFIDGFVYSITFSTSIFTGVLAAIGMVLHEFPEGIITYLLLLRGGFSDRNALLLAVIAASLSTPLGMLVSWPFISSVSQPQLGVLLSLSAGALVYVGATHLLPQAEKEHGRFSLLALGAGILVAVLIVLSK